MSPKLRDAIRQGQGISLCLFDDHTSTPVTNDDIKQPANGHAFCIRLQVVLGKGWSFSSMQHEKVPIVHYDLINTVLIGNNNWTGSYLTQPPPPTPWLLTTTRSLLPTTRRAIALTQRMSWHPTRRYARSSAHRTQRCQRSYTRTTEQTSTETRLCRSSAPSQVPPRCRTSVP